MIRDPRDVAASLMAAGRSWARWAPRNAVDAARLWVDHVTSVRRVRGAGYREMRYEALRRDPVAELKDALEWIGLEAEPDRCAEAVEACALDRLREADGQDLPLPGRKSPRGFFRKGEVEGWRHELSPRQIAVVEEVAGDVMRSAGYELSGVGSRAGARARVRLHDGLVRVREALDWKLEQLTRRV